MVPTAFLGSRHRESSRLNWPPFPLAVKTLLQQGLRLRDRHREGSVSAHGLAVTTGRLEAQLDRLLDRHFRCPANRRLAKHLRHEQPHLFTFLRSEERRVGKEGR